MPIAAQYAPVISAMKKLQLILLLWILGFSNPDHFLSASSGPLRQKPRPIRSSFGFNPIESFAMNNKVIPCNDTPDSIDERFFTDCQNSDDLATCISESPSSSKFFRVRRFRSSSLPIQEIHGPSLMSLPDELIQEIFEYLYRDFSTMRLICKTACQNFDDLMYKRLFKKFPTGDLGTFSQWSMDKYQLIKLSEVFCNVYSALPSVSTIFYIDIQHGKDPRDLSLRNLVLRILDHVKSADENEYFKLISITLKLNVIHWKDIEDQLIRNTSLLKTIYSLGVGTIAKQLLRYKTNLFIYSVGIVCRGLLLAIGNNHYHLSEFIIDSIREYAESVFANNIAYLGLVVEAIVNARYWNLLYKIYVDYPDLNYLPYLNEIAKAGSLFCFEFLGGVIREHPQGLAHAAASNGRLCFLQKLNKMKILKASAGPNENGETAIHAAVASGQLDCFIYLVDVLGTKWLNHIDNNGYMPIHLALKSKDTEILGLIIKFNPRYRTKNPLDYIKRELISPLNLAIECGSLRSVKILLQSFPELINFKDKNGDTVIHIAVTKSSIEMMHLLLNHAPDDIISARNRDGNTAVHLASELSHLNKIIALIATNQFNSLQRNNQGFTPFGICYRNNLFALPLLVALEIFKVSPDELGKAYSCDPSFWFKFRF